MNEMHFSYFAFFSDDYPIKQSVMNNIIKGMMMMMSHYFLIQSHPSFLYTFFMAMK